MCLGKKIDFVNSSIIHKVSDDSIQTKSKEKPQSNQETHTLPSNKTEIQTRHLGIGCSICKVFPIVGRRYKCLVCLGFDLCESCDLKNPHVHPMVRCIARQEEDALNKLNKKFVKISKKNEKGKISKILSSINPFKKHELSASNVTDHQFNIEDETESQKRQIMEFMDVDKILPQEALLKKYKHQGLEVFSQLIYKELSNAQVD